jgi:hypothetical protein
MPAVFCGAAAPVGRRLRTMAMLHAPAAHARVRTMPVSEALHEALLRTRIASFAGASMHRRGERESRSSGIEMPGDAVSTSANAMQWAFSGIGTVPAFYAAGITSFKKSINGKGNRDEPEKFRNPNEALDRPPRGAGRGAVRERDGLRGRAAEDRL